MNSDQLTESSSPPSNVREIQRINERELDLAVEGAASWHDDYRGEWDWAKGVRKAIIKKLISPSLT